MAQLALSFLGPWQVTLAGEAVTGFKYDKVRALLAYLAVEADRPHRRETLMGLLWPELPETAARNNLRQVLATLRDAIGDRTADPPFLLANRATIQFNPDSDYWLDVQHFVTLVTATERHPHRHPESCRACAQRWQQAVELYRGPFLAQFFLPDSAGFEEWALLKREWLNQLALSALARLATFHERRGHYEQALHTARRQLELEPWREAAHRQVMRLHLLNGERTAALAQYEQCRQILANELGVEPETETTALYEQIRDEAEDQPMALAQLSLPTARPHTLPPQPTPFVGREAELAEIGRLLNDAGCRLLTLTGPGGIGKTRLALQAASEQLDTFADGVFFVPLASLPSAGLLARAIAGALGLELGTAADPKAHLLTQLRDKELLLLLDNFEHLVEEATYLADILRHAPEVTLLVTSRERLNLQGESVFAVEGFRLPPTAATSTAADLADNDAVQLFVQSARRARHDFALSPSNEAAVVHICRLVAGLPLALELAAAWVRSLSCREIAQEIEAGISFLTTTHRDVPERHRSLTAVFDYSWQMLNEQEQAVLRHLAVFRGGFRRPAAVAVAGATAPLLTSLVDKSLLRHSLDGRYDLHELVRHYAAEKLAAAGETEQAERAHLDFFVELVETADANFNDMGQAKWSALLETEQDNCRAALHRAIVSGAFTSGLRLAAHLWWFWYTHGHLQEGRQWLEALFSAYAPPGNAADHNDIYAKALQGAGVLAWNQGDYPAARRFHEASLAIRQAQGNRRGVSIQLNNLANVAMDQGDYARAQTLLEESLALKRELGDIAGLASGLGNLGVVAYQQGEYAAARDLYEESLALKREVGDQRGIAITLGNLGVVLVEQGEYTAGQALLEGSLALKQELGDRWGVAMILRHLGDLALREERVGAARAFLQESTAIRQELGDRWSLADSLEMLASLTLAEGKPARAASLWGAADALRTAIGTHLSAGDRARHERDVAAVRQQLGEATFIAAWAEGQRLSIEEALACAQA